MTIFSC